MDASSAPMPPSAPGSPCGPSSWTTHERFPFMSVRKSLTGMALGLALTITPLAGAVPASADTAPAPKDAITKAADWLVNDYNTNCRLFTNEGVGGSESSGFEQIPRDVVSQVLEAEGGCAEAGGTSRLVVVCG